MIGSAQIKRLLLRCNCRLPVVCIILHPSFTSLLKNPPGGSNCFPLLLLYRFSLFLNKVNNDPRHALFLADVQLRVSSALNAIFSRRQGTDIAPLSQPPLVPRRHRDVAQVSQPSLQPCSDSRRCRPLSRSKKRSDSYRAYFGM